MQQVGQLLEVFLDFPAPAVGLTAQFRRDHVRKVGDQNDLGFAVAGRLVQSQDDSSQAIATPLALRIVNPDCLLKNLTDELNK